MFVFDGVEYPQMAMHISEKVDVKSYPLIFVTFCASTLRHSMPYLKYLGLIEYRSFSMFYKFKSIYPIKKTEYVSCCI